jgi:phosphoglycerol transferase MdoB-like AlkP superfamily enzyme
MFIVNNLVIKFIFIWRRIIQFLSINIASKPNSLHIKTNTSRLSPILYPLWIFILDYIIVLSWYLLGGGEQVKSLVKSDFFPIPIPAPSLLLFIMSPS